LAHTNTVTPAEFGIISTYSPPKKPLGSRPGTLSLNRRYYARRIQDVFLTLKNTLPRCRKTACKNIQAIGTDAHGSDGSRIGNHLLRWGDRRLICHRLGEFLALDDFKLRTSSQHACSIMITCLTQTGILTHISHGSHPFTFLTLTDFFLAKDVPESGQNRIIFFAIGYNEISGL
jgi:hypothetical protein